MTAQDDWRGVDEGWGRKAVDFATMSEPGNCREYVALHQHLGVGADDRVLDIACGAGLAVELAAARGARCAGLDAAERLVAVARDRVPGADLRVGDMHALPWADGSFDVVTSFRGIWGTTPQALDEALRVLVPGGRLGLTVWGHLKASPGAWVLFPFTLAAEPKVANQAAMVALGRPGAGEQLLAAAGFVDVERVEIPFAWEFADPEAYVRALASTGPAYEAIEAVGEDAFIETAQALAQERVRDGLPLRAEIQVVGYLARKPVEVASGAGFLAVPPTTAGVQSLYDDDVAQQGFVMNASRLWAHLPAVHDGLFDLLGQAARAAGLTVRQRGVLVTACASTLGDSYCSLAWGKKLAGEADAALAAAVLRGEDLADPVEQALAVWARKVTRDPNGTAAADVQALRDAGFDDAQVFAITTFVALRMAFSTVNDALGAHPDAELGALVPAPVRNAVTWGRPVDAP
jgi:SAM-dependent methyltransferase/alkylhydroperoxidase family enzyme